MPKLVSFTLIGISPYSQSKPHLTDMLPGESHEDYRARTWHEHLHRTKDGDVYIGPDAIKNCVSESAKFLNISIPGKGKNTYTKHVEAGVACIKPIMLGIKAKNVQSETLFLPADGRRGSGKRVWKTYPVMYEWSGVVELVILDETVLQTSARSGNTVLQDVVEGAGQYIGLGRFRPRNNGHYGRFKIEDFEVGELSVEQAA
jgi:hypothetical protein